MGWKVCAQQALIVAAVACPVLCGCAGVKSPSIAPAGATLIETSDEAIAFGVNVELRNPNDDELELREFNYRVRVAGLGDFSGRRAARTTLPPGGTRAMTLPAVMPVDSPESAAELGELNFEVNGSLTYVAPGQLAEILFDSGVRKPSVRFRHGGTVAVAPEP